MIKIMVVEDSTAVRAVWRQMLADIPGVVLAGEYSRAATAIEAARRDPPDVVLLDIQLAEGNGLEVVQFLSATFPAIKTIIATNYAEPIYRRTYMGAGAFAFYDKNSEISALRRAVEGLAKPPG